MSSLPKQYNPVFSSSPSRHSPFREGAATATTNPNLAASASLPIGRNDQPQITQRPEIHGDYGHSHEAENEDDDGNVNRPDPGFKPFFTLIEDANSGDYHHPTVHYIFSDDDPDLITEASLRALQGDGHDSSPPGQTNVQGSSLEEGGGGSEGGVLHKPSFLPPPLPGVKERFLILDVEQTNNNTTTQNPSSAPDAQTQFATSAGTAVSTSPTQRQTTHGYRIASAHSLTPDWQVLNTSLSLAPTFDTPQMTNDPEADPNASSSGALMLRIEGTAGFPRDIASGKDRDAKSQTLEEMMEQFEKRMAQLRRVIEAGGDRRDAPDAPNDRTEAGEAQPTDAGVVAHDAEPSVPESSPT